MAAPGLPDVLVGDPDPGKALRLGDQALEQLAVALLDVAAVGQPTSDVLDAGHERIANTLQLGDVEDPRPAGRRNRV